MLHIENVDLDGNRKITSAKFLGSCIRNVSYIEGGKLTVQ
jgi:hypothetical protein